MWFEACNDKEEHYSEQPGVVGEFTLMQLIDANPDLSKFAEVLRATGYDERLSGGAVYTVWAPVNAALQTVDMNDLEALNKIVSNHVARYAQSASGIEPRKIYMMNVKPLLLENRGESFYFYGVRMPTKNALAKNGLLHTLETLLPYRSNVWEFMKDNAGFDSLRTYLYSFDRYAFSPSSSKIIDFIDGEMVYDSVFIHTNTMFNIYTEGIGPISTEDSTFTMIQPTNQAWQSMYDRIYPYFKGFVSETNPDYSQHRADSLQDANTKYHLVRDLVFRGNLKETLSKYGVGDTLFSTTRAAFINPAHLFAEGEWHEASNGWVFTVDKLDYYNDEAWQRPIKVEGESSFNYIFTGSSANPPTNGRGRANAAYFSNDSTISNKGYLLVETYSVSDRPYVTFLIPNTIVGKYNLYCIFHPFTLDRDGSDKDGKKAKIRYGIYEWDRIGDYDKDDAWVKIDGSTGSKQTYRVPEWPSDGITLPDSITKMRLRSDFVFPHANARETRPTIQIRIATYAGSGDVSKNGFRNNMKIDYLILEPVRESE
jgi:uncharacterized surface protein with fasciclin (FAS1) repeats